AKAVKNIESGKFDGIIKIDFDYNDLNKIISSSISLNTKNNETYLVKSDGDSDDPNDVFANTIMYSNNKGVLTSEISANILDMIGEEKSDTQFSLPEEHGPTFITYRTCSSLPWKFIQIYPGISILGDSYFINFKWSIIILICFILIFVFLFVVRSVLLKPINRLTTVITEYEKGSFPTHTNLDITENNTDTPVRINQKSNVDNLINMVYYNQLKQKEAELNSLQSKINPHFLYNTLESIRGAALYHGIDSIAQMSKSLSLLFRYSINKNVVVTAREEIDNLNNYITIQNFRHDDKFNVILNIPDKAYDYKMLKMILQPIVENCIKHGLEMKLGKGTIRISIFDYGSIIKIEVCDDGDGISDEKIDELNKLMTEGDTTDVNDNQTAEGTGIGLQNVNSRIKLYFGNQYGVKICKADSGTTVEVILPVVE
ncbi:MAG: histidine kinase, partial [Bacillota bacterium]|nr:histidine kinase [Bacillota bacterium]